MDEEPLFLLYRLRFESYTHDSGEKPAGLCSLRVLVYFSSIVRLRVLIIHEHHNHAHSTRTVAVVP